MRPASVIAAASITTLLAGCLGGGGGPLFKVTHHPAPEKPAQGSSRCGTLPGGQPVECVPYLPRFPGDPVPGPRTPEPVLFTSWAELRHDVMTRAEGSRTAVSYFTAPEGRITSVSGLGMDTEPSFSENVSWTALFQYDASKPVNFSLRGGGGDLSADTDRRTLLNLAAAGQAWVDVGYRQARTDGYGPPTPFADLPARYLELVANPYEAGWNYQSFGVWNVTDISWVSAGGTSFGSATAAAAIPTSGLATFSGKLGGLYISSAGQGSIAVADVKVEANFSNRSLGFASSGTVTTRDVATTQPAPTLNLSGTLTYTPGTNAFSGTLSNAGGTMSGTSKGQFYGPTAQELGGVFTVKSATTVETFTGAYGAKR